MNHQKLKLKELSEKGIDPLTTPEIRYRLRRHLRKPKTGIKAELRYVKNLKITEINFLKWRAEQ